MVRKDTGNPSDDATCAWMAADEAVGCTRVFLTMWWSSRRLVCRGRPEPGLHEIDSTTCMVSKYKDWTPVSPPGQHFSNANPD
ncbi:uncharacterized protein TNCV_2997901 [Trichonephila clavipes]|nr:uncharacterized protein TNCV_2997901 [Trichonephila clavipes]